LERLILDCLAKIILKHPASRAVTAADHDVAKTYIMIWTWRTTATIPSEVFPKTFSLLYRPHPDP
jgi:hypothetical protein